MNTGCCARPNDKLPLMSHSPRSRRSWTPSHGHRLNTRSGRHRVRFRRVIPTVIFGTSQDDHGRGAVGQIILRLVKETHAGIGRQGFVYMMMAPSFPPMRMANHNPRSAQHPSIEALANHLLRVPVNHFHPRIFRKLMKRTLPQIFFLRCV